MTTITNTVGNRTNKKTLTKIAVIFLAAALVLTLGMTTGLAATPATSIHVFNVSDATTVQLQYDGANIDLIKQGGFWKTPDGGEYYTDDIDGIWVDGVFVDKAGLNIGVEARGTLNIWVGDSDPVTYTITTSVVNGTIDPDESGILEGDNRTINYSPTAGFVLLSVTVDGSPVNIGTYPSSFDFNNIDADHTIHVVYTAEGQQEAEFSILTSVVNGTIDPDVLNIPDDGTQDRTINYSPDSGFYLVSVQVDGAFVSIVTYPSSYAFNDIDSDHTVHVVYAENVVTDTNTSLLLILGSVLLLAGATALVLASRRKKAVE